MRNNQQYIDKIYLYPKDPYEAKYQYLIHKCEKVGLKDCDDPNVFNEYSNDLQDIYKKYWRTQSSKETQSVNSFWWYDCWYE